MDQFGYYLRRIRRKLGWTQAETARRAGLSVYAVAQIEAGRREPKTVTRTALERAVGHSISYSGWRQLCSARRLLNALSEK